MAAILHSPGMVCLLTAAVLVVAFLVYAVLRIRWLTTHIPTDEEVAATAEAILAARRKGLISYKSNLHFSYPEEWTPHKVGKEGYALRARGMGIRCYFGVTAVNHDPKFAKTTFPEMVKNIQDVARARGNTIKNIQARQIAGVPGVEYLEVEKNGHKVAGFFCCYQQGDFEITVDVPIEKQLKKIKPVIDAFLTCCEMRP